MMLNSGDEPFDLGFIQHLLRKIKFRLTMNVHSNACGDFTLLSRDHWHALRGYPELQGFSWHLDSVFLYQAVIAGIQVQELPKKQPIYHIEHGKGSGYTPENHRLVFDRIKMKGIPYLSDRELLKWVSSMNKQKKKKEPYVYNQENWGFANHKFREILI